MAERKVIPIGIEDFKILRDRNCFFVDKTLIIKELIDSGSMVTLFTRPRRFGKTLNMSMLRYFFEKTEQDNSYLFKNLKIAESGNKYLSYQGQYPVISISLKGMKQPTWEEAFAEFKEIVAKEIWRHQELFKSDSILPANKKTFEDISHGAADDIEYRTILKQLSDSLSAIYGKKVIVLIDEYDVPLENAYFNGFYDKMINLIRSVFESVLKTNDSLEFAVLTGCLRISKESIFTGLNNLAVCSIRSGEFSDYFGFTKSEVKELVDYYGVTDRLDELKKWYDGYLFGDTEIYNPWSVLNYIRSILALPNALPEVYWSNTSSNSIIHELITKGDRRTKADIERLVTGTPIDKPVYDDITYVNMNVNSEFIWSFLLHTGYLKPIKVYQQGVQNYFTAVIPNLEIVSVYENTFRQWFDDSVRSADKTKLLSAVINGDAETFQLEVNRWLQRSISYHDGYENFYHGFLVGLLDFDEEYLVESNREAGTGRNDIAVKNVISYDKAVIIEIKTVHDGETLAGQCEAALTQINERGYESTLRNEGYTKIVKLGIAFNGKQCMVKKG